MEMAVLTTICCAFHFQVKLHFTESARKSIARQAMSKNTGARGLRAIIESILVDAMYEVCFYLYFLKMNNFFIVRYGVKV
jgi:ATP-dependent protease Clp ATPase subunit